MIFCRIIRVITCYAGRQRKQAEVVPFGTEEHGDCAAQRTNAEMVQKTLLVECNGSATAWY